MLKVDPQEIKVRQWSFCAQCKGRGCGSCRGTGRHMVAVGLATLPATDQYLYMKAQEDYIKKQLDGSKASWKPRIR